MNIEHAKYFVTLCKTQHIMKAAKLLHISPTAISHGISKLEQELKIQLTAKVGRNIMITDKGIEFSKKMEKILAEIDTIKESFVGEVITEGSYQISVTHGLWTFVFNDEVRKIFEKTHNTQLDIKASRSADIIQAVSEGKIDLGLCFSPQDHPQINRKMLYKGNLVFLASTKNPIFKLKSIKDKINFLNENIAIGAKAFHGVENCERHPIFNTLGINPNYRYIVDSYELNLAIIKNSHAWSFVPDHFLNTAGVKEIDLGILKAPYTVEAIWNKERKPLKLIQKLIEEIESRFK